MRKRNRQPINALLLLVTAGVLTGCTLLSQELGTGYQNDPPQADAGANQVVIAGTTVILNGAGSSDANQDSLTYLWVPSGADLHLSATSDRVVRFTAPMVETPTMVTINLVVNDGRADSVTDSVTVRILPLNSDTTGAPEILASFPSDNARGMRKSKAEDLVVTFNESVANPSVSGVLLEKTGLPPFALSTSWDTTNTVLTITRSEHFASSSNYHLRISGYQDAHGNTMTTRILTFQTGTYLDEHTPIADAGLDMTVSPNAPVILDAAASYVLAGTIDSWEWVQWEADAVSVTMAVTHQETVTFNAPAQPGTYHFGVKVGVSSHTLATLSEGYNWMVLTVE